MCVCVYILAEDSGLSTHKDTQNTHKDSQIACKHVDAHKWANINTNTWWPCELGSNKSLLQELQLLFNSHIWVKNVLQLKLKRLVWDVLTSGSMAQSCRIFSYLWVCSSCHRSGCRPQSGLPASYKPPAAPAHLGNTPHKRTIKIYVNNEMFMNVFNYFILKGCFHCITLFFLLMQWK